MKSRVIVILVIVALGIGLGGWYGGWYRREPDVSRGNAAKLPDQPYQVGKYVDPILDEIATYGKETRASLAKGDFDALEARAKEALEGKQRFGNGGWKLFRFYVAVASPPTNSGGEWEALQKQLAAWLEARPKSATAHIALADFWKSYAWDARGSDTADKVTEEGWRLLKERLTKAREVLEAARPLGIKDPHFYRVYQTVALGLELPDSEHDSIYAQAIALEPQYYSIYVAHAQHLLPRWGGKPGQLEQFAEEAAKVPGGLGAEAYARIALAMDEQHSNVFQEAGLKWARAKEGLELMRQRYPQSVSVLSDYAMLAVLGNDPSTARHLLIEIGNRLDTRTWSKQEKYEYYLKYVK